MNPGLFISTVSKSVPPRMMIIFRKGDVNGMIR